MPLLWNALLLNVNDIQTKVRMLKQRNHARDARYSDLLAIRSGEVERAFPEFFNESFRKPLISNFIDISARDLAETLAPLPAFNAASGSMVSDAARKAADKRTKGANYYIEHSRLQRQMYTGADYYFTFGMMPVYIEPDFGAKCPRIVIESPVGAYPEFDRWGRIVSYSRCIHRPLHELVALYPEHERALCQGESPGATTRVEMVLYRDAEQTMLYVPSRGNLILEQAEQRLGQCPVRVAMRPSVDGQPHGQFDDILWVQLARHRFALLGLEAAEMSVEAPLALPLDVQEFAIGPHATIRTNNPERIRRVGVEIPQAAFAESQLLDQELKVGARYPGTRTGNFNGSIVTGQAIRELNGGFDSQIKAGQDILADVFRDVIGLCFRMDETYWPNEEKSLRGNRDGVPYEIKWVPKRDINGAHDIEVSYGFSAGLDPNRALVFLLQLLGGGLVSKDLVRRQMPFGVNVTEESQKIEVENLREGLVQSVMALAQAIPVYAQQGQDPTEILAKVSDVIKARQKGTAIEDAITKAFAPEPPPGASSSDAGPAANGPGMSAPGGVPPGMDASGLMQGVAPGQAGMPPGGAPDLMTLLAGIGQRGPQMSAAVQRRIPA